MRPYSTSSSAATVGLVSDPQHQRRSGVSRVADGKRPTTLRDALNEHEAVSEAAVVGVPVDGLNQVKAFLVPSEGRDGSEDLAQQIQEWSQDKLKGYKKPQLVEFVEELPKNPMGKLQRKRLRESESRG